MIAHAFFPSIQPTDHLESSNPFVYDPSVTKFTNFWDLCCMHPYLPIADITQAALAVKERRTENGLTAVTFRTRANDIFEHLVSGSYYGDTSGEIAIMILGISFDWNWQMLSTKKKVHPLVREYAILQVALMERLARIVK